MINLKAPKQYPTFSGTLKFGPNFKAWEEARAGLAKICYITNSDSIWFDINSLINGTINVNTVAAIMALEN